MDSIYVGGNVAIGQGSFGEKRTYINLECPCNKDGVVTTVNTLFMGNTSAIKVGSFYQLSGNVYKCRDSASFAPTSTVFTTLSTTPIIFKIGDFIGIWTVAGTTEGINYGGAGVVGASGDFMTPNATFIPTHTYSPWKLCLNGTGEANYVGQPTFKLRRNIPKVRQY
jgi:hypothetical protein